MGFFMSRKSIFFGVADAVFVWLEFGHDSREITRKESWCNTTTQLMPFVPLVVPRIQPFLFANGTNT